MVCFFGACLSSLLSLPSSLTCPLQRPSVLSFPCLAPSLALPEEQLHVFLLFVVSMFHIFFSPSEAQRHVIPFPSFCRLHCGATARLLFSLPWCLPPLLVFGSSASSAGGATVRSSPVLSFRSFFLFQFLLLRTESQLRILSFHLHVRRRKVVNAFL